MSRVISLLYGALCYVFFLAVFVYALAFVEGIAPKAIDTGPEGPPIPALLMDTALLGLFALQHSVMARPAFKRWWTRFVPTPVERSTYVLLASSALALLMWQWRPAPQVIWSIADPATAAAVKGVSFLGWGIVLLSTFLISHFELFGLKQVFDRWRNRTAEAPVFRTPLLYGLVRHPLYLGFLIAFWAAPTMTLGHLVFAAATAGYIVIGIWLEERDLVDLFGSEYRNYRTRVSMLVPLPRLWSRSSAKPKLG
jgi:protein-S-isoprenylcysteine O-methyltransferase Ste14